MLIGTIKDRVWCTTSTPGEGTYISNGPADGFLDVDEIGHGVRAAWCCSDGVNWELFYGTVAVGGNKSVTRDQIIRSTEGNGPVDWGSGTRDLFCVVPAQDVVVRNRTTVFEADQDLNGMALLLSPNGALKLQADDTKITLTASNGLTLELGSAGNGEMVLAWSEDGAGSGPRVRGKRISASPAASDVLRQDLYTGRNSAAADINYALVQATIRDPANGAEDGGYTISCTEDGALTVALRINEDVIALGETGTRHVSVGKTTADNATAGIELRNDGFFAAIRNAQTVGAFDRLGDDGTIVQWRRSGTVRGSVSISGSTTNYATTSDGRLKENVQPLEAGLLIDRLRPVRFTWRETGQEDAGLIAQELAQVLPQAVMEGEDGYLQAAYSHGALVAAMIAELQALRARVAQLEGRP